jgi:hypothetical protein
MASRRRATIEAEIARLKCRLQSLQLDLDALPSSVEGLSDLPMDLLEYRRYGRQMILDGFGLSGMINLMDLSLLLMNPTPFRAAAAP